MRTTLACLVLLLFAFAGSALAQIARRGVGAVSDSCPAGAAPYSFPSAGLPAGTQSSDYLFACVTEFRCSNQNFTLNGPAGWNLVGHATISPSPDAWQISAWDITGNATPPTVWSDSGTPDGGVHAPISVSWATKG